MNTKTETAPRELTIDELELASGGDAGIIIHDAAPHAPPPDIIAPEI